MNAPSSVSWSEQFRLVANQYVDAEAAASLYEDTKSAVLAEMMQAYVDLPINRAEQKVKSSPGWREHLMKMVEARKVATRLKLHLEWIRMRHAEEQSANATRRAEMRL